MVGLAGVDLGVGVEAGGGDGTSFGVGVVPGDDGSMSKKKQVRCLK